MITWNTNASAANNASIAGATNANDPTPRATTVGQYYRSTQGNFGMPNETKSGYNALWDFSLRDNGAPQSTTYCFRIAYTDGSPLERTASAPQITTSPGSLDVGFYNASGAVVASPSFALTGTNVQTVCQLTTGTLGLDAQRLRVSNTTVGNGWALSIAATNGTTAVWNRSDNNAKYDYNDASGSPPGCSSGSDGDGFAGRLTVDPSTATWEAQSGCNTTGITSGSTASFTQGTVDAITLANASAATQTRCYWESTGATLQQRIPSAQASGSYSISMTVTVVAQ